LPQSEPGSKEGRERKGCQPHLTKWSHEDGSGLCFHHKQARDTECEGRASWSLFSSTRRQLGSKQTTEAQRGLAPRNLVSSEPFQPMRTPLNINSRTGEGMRQDFTFSGRGKEKCAEFRPYLELWVPPPGAPPSKRVTDRSEVMQREQAALGTTSISPRGEGTAAPPD